MSNKPIRLLLGGDSAGFDYKDAILADMQADERVEVVEDLGVYADDLENSSYPQVAIAAAEKIAAGEADRAILVCGTGIGVAIAANKVPGIRATVAHDSFSVERSILSNDCQILTLGQRVIGLQLARRLAKEWLGYIFDPDSPSYAKVSEIIEYEDNDHRLMAGAPSTTKRGLSRDNSDGADCLVPGLRASGWYSRHRRAGRRR